MLYETVLPGVAPEWQPGCPGCGAEFAGPAGDRSGLEAALAGTVDQLNRFLRRYPTNEVRHMVPACPLRPVRAALLITCDDVDEALVWERECRKRLGEPPLGEAASGTPD
ncbi:hypothetical protein JCM4814A_22750 [Streptomyces phaeofaciens JCM 4814]|uniref:Uncharacterized protein n=1 Tax=Streptomyces phaeofaciens TaxID=68254 RepID=A0A918LPF8_9ACTN|nr:hypothetical protein [Streptomyces phaeofaciens]GGT34465.1 hypothetical protein GCM10010226_08100 [Streptomyces phaeofaciens]